MHGHIRFAFFLPHFSGPGDPYFVRYSFLYLYEQRTIPSSKALEFHHIRSDSEFKLELIVLFYWGFALVCEISYIAKALVGATIVAIERVYPTS